MRHTSKPGSPKTVTSVSNSEAGFHLRGVLTGKLGKDLVAYLPAKVVPALIAFISIPVYTRFFNPEEYGLYTLLISAISLATLVLFSWLFHSSLRYFDQHVSRGEQESFLSTVILSWMAIVVAVFGISAVAIVYVHRNHEMLHEPRLIVLAIVAVLMLGSHSLYNTVLDLLRSTRRSRLYAMFMIVLPAGRLLGVALLVTLRGMGIEAILISTFVFECLLAAAGLLLLKVRVSPAAYSFKLFRRIFAYGAPLVGSAVLAWLLSLSDRYIIGFYHGTKEVGIYSIAYTISASALQTVFMVLMFAAFPIIIQTWNSHGRESTEKLVSSLVRYYCAFTVPVVAGVAVLGRPLLELLATEQYIEGYTVLPWVAAGLFCLGLSQYINKIWELREKTAVILILNGIAVAVNIGLNLAYVPRYGYWAAGVTTLISYVVFLLSSWLLSRRQFSIKVNLPSMSKILLSTAVMATALMVVKYKLTMSPAVLITAIFAGAAIYIAGLYLLGEFRSETSFVCTKIKKVIRRDQN